MEALQAYSSDDEGQEETDGPTLRPLALPSIELVANPQSGLDSGRSDSEEENDHSEEQCDQAGERYEDDLEAAPLSALPLAFAVNDQSSDDEAAEKRDPEPEVPSALPPPDFSGWPDDLEAGALTSLPAAPKVATFLGGGRKRKAGAHHISAGFKPALTRHDQLVKAKEDELEQMAGACAAPEPDRRPLALSAASSVCSQRSEGGITVSLLRTTRCITHLRGVTPSGTSRSNAPR